MPRIRSALDFLAATPDHSVRSVEVSNDEEVRIRNQALAPGAQLRITGFLALDCHGAGPYCDENNFGTLYIEPGSPWENGYVESFNGKLRDEFLNREIFFTLREASPSLCGLFPGDGWKGKDWR